MSVLYHLFTCWKYSNTSLFMVLNWAKNYFHFWSISFLVIDIRHAWYTAQTNTFFMFDRLYITFSIHNHYNMTNMYRDMIYIYCIWNWNSLHIWQIVLEYLYVNCYSKMLYEISFMSLQNVQCLEEVYWKYP